MTASSALARARAAWGEAPDWIAALAAACDGASQASIAKRIGYSAATVSYVLAHRYAGDVAAVEKAVRGALMRTTVRCPVLGELAADRCIHEQREPFSSRNPQRVALYRACRSGCPHSRLTRSDNHA